MLFCERKQKDNAELFQHDCQAAFSKSSQAHAYFTCAYSMHSFRLLGEICHFLYISLFFTYLNPVCSGRGETSGIRWILTSLGPISLCSAFRLKNSPFFCPKAVEITLKFFCAENPDNDCAKFQKDWNVLANPICLRFQPLKVL